MRKDGFLRAVAVVLATGVLAACTGTSQPEQPDVPLSTTTATAPSVPDAPAPDGPDVRLRLVPVARVPLPRQPLVVGLRVAGPRILFAGCTDCSRDGDTRALYAHDLRTGRTTVTATTDFPTGVIVPLGGDADSIVWQDIAAVAPQLGSRTEWRLNTLNVSTGRRRTLTGTSPGTRSTPPWTVVRDGLVAWQDLEGDSLTGPVHVADLARGTVRLAATGLPGPLTDVTADDLLYVGAWPPDRPDLDVADPGTPSDAFALPLHGWTVRRLTSSHDVGSVGTDGETVLWSTPRGASNAVWAKPLSGGDARLVYRGGNVERVAGRGFVAVLTDGDPVLRVAPIGGGRVLTAADVPLAAAGLVTFGTRLAYVAAPGRGEDPDARHPLQLVVVEVR